MIYGSWKVKVVGRKIAMVRGLDTPWMRLYILTQRPPDLYRAKRHIARSEYVTIPPIPSLFRHRILDQKKNHYD